MNIILVLSIVLRSLVTIVRIHNFFVFKILIHTDFGTLKNDSIFMTDIQYNSLIYRGVIFTISRSVQPIVNLIF